jgi:hypothetical protein
MAQQKPPRGLPTYFSHVAYDIDLNQIRERGNRRYLEYRIRQVERWVVLQQQKIDKSGRHSPEFTSLTLDLAYLLAVRQALLESLSLLPGP